ncbi:MAG: hypothetical protein EA349_03595 [Halomonadaceae bacterium]|nr:MAG: hypothetical protein EA349_03595 [Halomonadaceae bacterium]
MAELELGYQLPYVPFNRMGAGWLLAFLGQEVGLRMQPYGRGVTGNIVQEYGAGMNLRLGHQVPAFTALPVAREGFS